MTKRMPWTIVSLLAMLWLMGCQSAYYGQSAYYDTLEQVGVHKRDILTSRVEKARDSQQAADEQFASALEHYRSVVNVPESELSQTYDQLNADYEDSQRAAEQVSERIDAIESVAGALFAEWEGELDEYQNASYRQQSAEELRQTRQRYDDMIKAMRDAEQSMDPVLVAMHDNVLFLKHNLNARAIGALKGEVRNLENDVAQLRQRMQTAITRSNAFIAAMPASADDS